MGVFYWRVIPINPIMSLLTTSTWVSQHFPRTNVLALIPQKEKESSKIQLFSCSWYTSDKKDELLRENDGEAWLIAIYGYGKIVSNSICPTSLSFIPHIFLFWILCNSSFSLPSASVSEDFHQDTFNYSAPKKYNRISFSLISYEKGFLFVAPPSRE